MLLQDCALKAGGMMAHASLRLSGDTPLTIFSFCVLKASGMVTHASLCLSGDTPAVKFVLVRFQNTGHGRPCVPTPKWDTPR